MRICGEFENHVDVDRDNRGYVLVCSPRVFKGRLFPPLPFLDTYRKRRAAWVLHC